MTASVIKAGFHFPLYIKPTVKAFIIGDGKKIALVRLGIPGGSSQAINAPIKAVIAPMYGPKISPKTDAMKASIWIEVFTAPVAILMPGMKDIT